MRHACRRMRWNFSKDDGKGKRMARKIKYTRKDLKGPDELISTLGRATLWIKGNPFPVLATLTAVILAAGGVFGTRAYNRWQEAKANRDLWPQLIQTQEVLRSPGVADEEKLDRLEKFLAGPGRPPGPHPGNSASRHGWVRQEPLPPSRASRRLGKDSAGPSPRIPTLLLR